MNVYVPSDGPSDWQRLLAEPEKHWRRGFSAQAVALSWESSKGVPPEIDRLLGGGLELLLAIPEHKVTLPGVGKPSQCDVFALVRQGDCTIALSVEGKVDEPFGPAIADWLKEADSQPRRLENRLLRLHGLASILGVHTAVPRHLHYQLLHRTAAALIEARRFKTDKAAMVVQSFSQTERWFSAFAEFASFLGTKVAIGERASIGLGNGPSLEIGWAIGNPAFVAEDPSVEPPLYDRDFHAWLQEQAANLRTRSRNGIDWDNLAEEIESVGRSQKREIRSRLEKLITHLLKWQFRPGRRSESWRITIGEQRTFIPGIVEDSPSLRGFPAEIFAKVYAAGRRDAIVETGLAANVFPVEPPFSIGQALDYGFLPGDRFEPWEVFRD